jgi:hypothetical protein
MLKPVLRGSQRFFPSLVLDAQSNLIGNTSHGLEGGAGEGLAGEHGQHAHELVFHEQWITRKGDHALPPGPLRVTDARVVGDIVGQQWLLLLGN